MPSSFMQHGVNAGTVVITGSMVIAALLWLAAVIAGYVLGEERNRGLAGFVLALLFGPLGVVMALLLKPGVDEELVTDLDALSLDKGRTGIAISPKEPGSVAAVLADSPAQSAGVQPGDRLISIDGIPCSTEYRALFLQLLGDPGSNIRLKIRRNTEVLDLDLTRS